MFGIEKESLRVSRNGYISQRKHPDRLGAALTNPFITTDFSEALVEIVTPPFNCVNALYRFINQIHRDIYQAVLAEDEMLWASSMPCILQGDQEIPIADYGKSNLARLKNLYRQGLGYRYGRSMQTIAGVHYNFSFTCDALAALQQAGLLVTVNDFYMGGARNILRLNWLLLYLFGASPAVCRSYLNSQPKLDLTLLGEDTDHTVYLDYATSLRMSPIGYSNKRMGSANVSFNSLEDYLIDLRTLLETESEEYAEKSGNNIQINSKILQIENELYANVRPKQNLVHYSERHFNALKARGIRYLEVRLLDINPFSQNGVTKNQLLFMKVFLSYCLFSHSSQFNDSDYEWIKNNNEVVSMFGRDSKQKIHVGEKHLSIPDAYAEIVDGLTELASMMDSISASKEHTRAVAYYSDVIKDKELTLSSRFLDFMANSGASFHDATKALSENYRDFYRNSATHLSDEWMSRNTTAESIDREQSIEDEISFDDYVREYLRLT